MMRSMVGTILCFGLSFVANAQSKPQPSRLCSTLLSAIDNSEKSIADYRRQRSATTVRSERQCERNTSPMN